MLVEKYMIIGIKHPRNVVTDVTKHVPYNSENLIDPISVVKENKNDIFLDLFGKSFITKSQAFERLNIIRGNVPDVMYWSILPIVVEVSKEEARYLKLVKLKKKIK